MSDCDVHARGSRTAHAAARHHANKTLGHEILSEARRARQRSEIVRQWLRGEIDSKRVIALLRALADRDG